MTAKHVLQWNCASNRLPTLDLFTPFVPCFCWQFRESITWRVRRSEPLGQFKDFGQKEAASRTQFWTATNEKLDLHSRDVKSALNIQILFISGSKSIQREVNMCMAELVIHRVFLTC